jgi:hypothetical protein
MVQATNGGAKDAALVPLRDLPEQLKVSRKTLDRIAVECGIERQKYPGDRRTWVDINAVRRALEQPHRRPERKPRPGGQRRDGAGRFAPKP